ncbi:hypothetical protein [Streptomyces phaeochromogenes]|uniref:hypothetical protein n=1 Tax=Streptomyces phaeochromogenes TaxID=1923 RepID=UPI00371D9F8F
MAAIPLAVVIAHARKARTAPSSSTVGRVREEGDFRTLMARDGLFAELYRLAQDR